MSEPLISVVIRAKNEAASIGRTLELLASQTIADRTQIIVVDSGSTDATVEIVRGHGVTLVQIPAASFTYGGALNTGTEHATAEVVVALSAHSFPRDDAWLERMLDAMADENVAAASGQGVGPDGALMRGRIVQDLALARAHPLWGYSSHAGGFRRSLWQQRGFRADMPFSEDKEWAWHWLQQGRTAVLDPGLIVDHGHGDDPLREQLRRGYLHWVGVSMFLPVERQTVRGLRDEWWNNRESYESALRARLSPKRVARLAGAFAGRRVGSRRSKRLAPPPVVRLPLVADPAVSVVIRAKDEADSIGRTLDLLAAQTIAARTQVIVVDSGSTDATVDIVRAHGAELIEIPAASFTYGGALNTGAAQARADVVVALSAHSFPTDDSWLERMLDAMGDENVACASGQTSGPHGEPLDGPVVQDEALARANLRWGYSSHAGGFRTALWRRRGFRTDMPASEDKEWAWHWLQQGHVAVFGPDLMVDHSHGNDPLRDQYRRSRIDWVGLGMFSEVAAPSRRELVAEWWTESSSYDSALRARLSPKRLARLLGGYAGRREASRRS